MDISVGGMTNVIGETAFVFCLHFLMLSSMITKIESVCEDDDVGSF